MLNKEEIEKAYWEGYIAKQNEAMEFFENDIEKRKQGKNYFADYEKVMIYEETVLNIIQTQQAEIEKKDKIIEYMANFINDNTPYTKDTRILENERGVRNTKYTEQYFERKVENGN